MIATKTETDAGRIIFHVRGQWFAVQWPCGQPWRVGWAMLRWLCLGLLTYQQARYVYRLAKELEAMR